MASVSVEIKGLDQLQSAFSKAPDVVAKESRDAIMRSLILLQAAAKERTPRDRGGLWNSIKPKMISSLEGQLVIEGTGEEYAIFVHEGTRPHFPPLAAIAPWAESHGIPAFALALSIARKGTKPYPFFKWAREAKEADINGIFENALKNILAKLSK